MKINLQHLLTQSMFIVRIGLVEEINHMTYTELNITSGAWGFTLGSICGDMRNNARYCMTKREFAKAKVSDKDIETIMFWAKKEGIGIRVAADLAFAGIELNQKGECSICRRDQPMGYHIHACE